MKAKMKLHKLLSMLLALVMVVGMMPALSITASAETYGYHSLTGYVNEWSESFENVYEDTDWTQKDKDGDDYYWGPVKAKAYAHCGNNFLCSKSENESDERLTPNDWLYSPLIELSGSKEHVLTFYACGWGNTFGVFVSKDYSHTEYVQLGSDYTIPSDTEWHKYTIDLSEYAGYDIKLAFVHHNSSSIFDLYLDCVNTYSRPKGYTWDGIYDFESVEFEEGKDVADVPNRFVAADRDEDGECWKVAKGETSAHSGECYLRSCKGSTDVEMNNWLVLPKKTLANDKDHLLTFYVTDTSTSQSVDVYVYGNRLYDYNAPWSDLNRDGQYEYFSKVLTRKIDIYSSVNRWIEVRVDLSDYAGQDVYVAIVQNGGEGEIRVDDIAWWKREPHTPVGDRTSVFYEGFENDDESLPLDWLAEDIDGDGNNWNVKGAALWKHHDRNCVISKAYNDSGIPGNNWLYMPSYTVSETKKTTLTFETCGANHTDYNEVFGVYISVDGGKYEQIGEDFTTSFIWKEKEVDLTPYAGKEIKVAVVHHNSNTKGQLLLDCFNIWEEPIPPVKKVNVTLAKPTVGEAVPTTNAEAIKLVSLEGYAFSVSPYMFQWKKTTKEQFENAEVTPTYTVVSNGETFDAGYVYQLLAKFKLDECYTFYDKATVFVNSAYGVADSTVYGNCLDIIVPFYPFEAYITDIAVTVPEPVVGAVPDNTLTYVTTPNAELGYVIYWKKALKKDYTTLKDTDWDYVASTETFAEGYVYAMVLQMGNFTQPQYEISPDVTVSVNGKPALAPYESYYYNPREIRAAAVFDLSSTMAPTGYTVSGTATSFNSDTDEVIIQLTESGASEPAYETVVKGNSATYSIDGVEPGTYTMKVMKKNHVMREYTVTVSAENVTQDVKICLLGDVNMDGAVSITDATEVQKGIAGLLSLNEYQNKLADVNKDGSVSIIDATQIQKYLAGLIDKF